MIFCGKQFYAVMKATVYHCMRSKDARQELEAASAHNAPLVIIVRSNFDWMKVMVSFQQVYDAVTKKMPYASAIDTTWSATIQRAVEDNLDSTNLEMTPELKQMVMDWSPKSAREALIMYVCSAGRNNNSNKVVVGAAVDVDHYPSVILFTLDLVPFEVLAQTMATTLLTYCNGCHELEISKSHSKFKYCSKCFNAHYCSKQCQEQDWRRGHKNSCIAKEKASAVHFR